ncbi:MAG: hypothetical protein ISS34_01485 [Candidatus Omnitrophica bacterium]|nr:hypothetical protein [Candidatus Omnitrophota bacterium]
MSPVRPYNKNCARRSNGVRFKIAVLSLMLIALFAEDVFCNEESQARSLFYQGNTQYRKGDFKEAVLNYQKALDSGFESGPLYYNIGNAYFKNGSLGKAILNYLRAKRFLPRDADLKSNLEYARSLIKGGAVRPERGFFARQFFKLADAFSLDKITLFTSVTYFILSLALVLFIFIKKIRRILIYITLLVSALLIVFSSVLYVQVSRTVIEKKGVIITDGTNARFEPLDEATTFFSLNEGECVTLVTSKIDWVKIKRPDGKQGWIQKRDIEAL